MSYEEMREKLLSDASSSNWIKKALLDLEMRDVVDGLNDLELLVEVMNLKLRRMV